MNGGLNQFNGLNETPFDRLRANGLIQSFLNQLSCVVTFVAFVFFVDETVPG